MKRIIVIILVALSYFSGLLLPATSLAAVTCTDTTSLTQKQQIQCGTCAAAGTAPADCDPGAASDTITALIRQVVNILSFFVGAIAVVMIIVGGFRYVTSAGNPESAKGARNTILYAIVGLVVVAAAQLIVHYVLNNVNTKQPAQSPSNSTPAPAAPGP